MQEIADKFIKYLIDNKLKFSQYEYDKWKNNDCPIMLESLKDYFITVRDNLLYKNKMYLGVFEADRYANKLGFIYAEQLIVKLKEIYV